MIGLGIYVVIFIKIFFNCISNSWENSTLQNEAIDLPIYVNWIGVAGLWFFGFWKSALRAYNINFTLCFLPMKNGYVLATGGAL